MSLRRIVALVPTVLVLAACDPGTPPMSDTGLPDTFVGTDAPDVPVLPAGPCETDADCPVGLCATESATFLPDGFCWVDCATDAECPESSHCVLERCSLDCASSDECRSGYLCFDRDEDGRTECAAAGTGTAPFGSPCAAVDECAGGTFAFCLHGTGSLAMGYCSDFCTDDAACGPEAHCSPVPGIGDVCLSNCTSDADCLDTQVCDPLHGGDDVRECWPRFNPDGVPPGGACTEAMPDCRGRSTAACAVDPNFGAGYCTYECTSDADCETGTHCSSVVDYRLEGCFQDCVADSDCRTGYGCVDVDDNGSTECWTAGIGTAAIGDDCTSIADCAGRERALCMGGGDGVNICAYNCRAEACPAGSLCINAGSLAICTPTCVVDEDCATGLRCLVQPDGMACDFP